ncbi:DUF1572 family protein [Lacicoccus qingdaonensis]|uniref:DUF1572 domain-containing protein n=1 Tax=Lacicoccus qingdaonensis TaxID=576118 RepID=A0A1G9EJI2_9BACL|nr:DUF1572 family protein [Salinicoccus qingdaonensis]SDK76201.1 Protein of unknown function [Salinicoccus qingdaonensis]
MNIEERYLNTVIEKFKDVKNLGDRTIEQLTESELQWSMNEESNSIAVIMKHLSGNMISRWSDFLTSDGEKESRDRDSEFTDDGASRQEMLEHWELGWETLLGTLSNLEGEDLRKTVRIRSEEHVVIEAIERQMSHYSYHIGQIVYIGKQIKGDDFDTLTIPKGQSEQYLNKMKRKYDK